MAIVLSYIFLFQFRESWQGTHTKESNYFTIYVENYTDDIKALRLDHLYHSFLIPEDPTALKYDYLVVFEEIVSYVTIENPVPRVLHLGGAIPSHGIWELSTLEA